MAVRVKAMKNAGRIEGEDNQYGREKEALKGGKVRVGKKSVKKREKQKGRCRGSGEAKNKRKGQSK